MTNSIEPADDTNHKLVFIEHDFSDRWCVTHLIKTYVYINSSHQSHLKTVNLKKKDICEINQVALNFCEVYIYSILFIMW